MRSVSSFSVLGLALFLFCLVDLAHGQAEQDCSGIRTGASIYLPLYSHIYFGDGLRPFNLAATMSFRNVDSEHGVEIVRADYFDSNGKRLRSFIDKAIVLGPLAAHNFKLKESDVAGGSGASLFISWRSATGVLPPLVESVMIGASAGQGISFTSRGVTVECGPESKRPDKVP